VREINQNPEVVVELRRKYNLLPDLPKQLEADIVPYFKESVAARAIPADGGHSASKDDLAFFRLAGHLQGDATSLKAEDFWDFGPLTRAKARAGRK
jgi:NitT/TauT family transport system substrate-binding protein